MKNIGLNEFYIKISKQILLAQSYTEIPELSKIIKICRLKPYDHIVNRINDVVLYRWWFDEFGHSLRIKNKSLQIIYNDLELDLTKIVCTDLYYGLSLDKITKMSKVMYLYAGTDLDYQQPIFHLTFYGVDNYLRSYLYSYNNWEPTSPLLLGLDNLKMLSENSDIKYFKNCPIDEKYILPCFKPRAWLSCLPIPDSFAIILNKEYQELSFLKENK